MANRNQGGRPRRPPPLTITTPPTEPDMPETAPELIEGNPSPEPAVVAYEIAHGRVGDFPKGVVVMASAFAPEQVERLVGLGAILPIYEAAD